MLFRSSLTLFLVLFVAGVASGQVAGDVDARTDPSAVADGLSSVDPLIRQQAAEDLARLAAVTQRRRIEGHRLQEKDKRVRLALDWALYRTGKAEAIYAVVRDLDSARYDQAVGYLSQVDSPSLLHDFLKTERGKPRITAGIITALTTIGDRQSLELIQPHRDSLLPGVAAAAERASDEIEKRLAQPGESLRTRPRTVKTSDQIDN